MGTMTEPTTHRAKQIHRCSWCWERINPGEEYRRYRFFDGGDSGTVKMHPECMGAMEEAADEEGGWIEWIPGKERPQPNVELTGLRPHGATNDN